MFRRRTWFKHEIQQLLFAPTCADPSFPTTLIILNICMQQTIKDQQYNAWGKVYQKEEIRPILTVSKQCLYSILLIISLSWNSSSSSYDGDIPLCMCFRTIWFLTVWLMNNAPIHYIAYYIVKLEYWLIFCLERSVCLYVSHYMDTHYMAYKQCPYTLYCLNKLKTPCEDAAFIDNVSLGRASSDQMIDGSWNQI